MTVKKVRARGYVTIANLTSCPILAKETQAD